MSAWPSSFARSALVTFVRVAGLGVLVGFAIGLTVSEVVRRVDDPMIETTLTTIAAYGSFVVAEHFHYSGEIATVTAGLLCGNYGARTGMSATTRIAVGNFWEYLAFALNSIVFLLIGFEVSLSALAYAWKPILVAYCVVTLGRALVAYAVAAAVKKTRESFPFKWAGALTWGGLRGSLSMVLALSLPASMHNRELLVVMTFGVVLLSILVQGSTRPRLVKLICWWASRMRTSTQLARYKRTTKRSCRMQSPKRRYCATRCISCAVWNKLRSSIEHCWQRRT